MLDKDFEFKIEHQLVLPLFANYFVNIQKLFPSRLKQILYVIQSLRNDADYKEGVNKKKVFLQLKMLKEFYKTVFGEQL
jgi:hypothetical protein